MITSLDDLRELNFTSLILRLSLAMFCGGLIGLERGRKGQAAGFRTYMLVSIGACLSIVLSQYDTILLRSLWHEQMLALKVNLDVSRFGSYVINGVGFLGAGTILITGRQQVKGLTTAAGLWASACLGLAIGAGFYEAVIMAIVLMFLAMRFFPILESIIVNGSRFMNIYVELDSLAQTSELLEALNSNHIRVLSVEAEALTDHPVQLPFLVLGLRLPPATSHADVLNLLSELECIKLLDEI